MARDPDTDLLANIPPVDTLLVQMTADLRALLQQRSREDPLFIGIHTGGIWLARALMERLGITGQPSELDVSLYRDDYDSKGLKSGIRATRLPDSTADRHLVLVDDVIMTGRTIRGAINQLFDYGRPASVSLVELIDLPARELPLQADVVGHRLADMPAQRIRLQGPEPLQLALEPWSPGR